MEIKSMSYNQVKDYFSSADTALQNDLVNVLMADERKNVQALGYQYLRRQEKLQIEIDRVRSLYAFDKGYGKFLYVAGVDEVGRGPLAGPIVAAAVILDLEQDGDESLILGIKDSKKMTPKSREEISERIKEKAVAYSIACLSHHEIDERGIGWCNHEVFRRAIFQLSKRPELVLSDGYPVKNLPIQNAFMEKGDTLSASIACASIIAKVFRDQLMREYAKEFPQFGFDRHVGYGTEEHVQAIKKYGPCKIHRRSFLRNIL